MSNIIALCVVYRAVAAPAGTPEGETLVWDHYSTTGWPDKASVEGTLKLVGWKPSDKAGIYSYTPPEGLETFTAVIHGYELGSFAPIPGSTPNTLDDIVKGEGDYPDDYSVVVGNIGTVYEGKRLIAANATYQSYVEKSKRGEGRCAGEGVTLFVGGEPWLEYHGTLEEE